MNWEKVNWEMWGCIFAAGALISGWAAIMFSPIKKVYEFHREVTKIGGENNYFDLVKKVNLVYEDFKYNNSPQVKELEAKIVRLEAEKEVYYNQALSDIKYMLTDLQKEVQEIKIDKASR